MATRQSNCYSDGKLSEALHQAADEVVRHEESGCRILHVYSWFDSEIDAWNVDIVYEDPHTEYKTRYR